MSQYLIEQIAETPRITVKTSTRVGRLMEGVKQHHKPLR